MSKQDLKLAILASVVPPGTSLTQQEIARATGFSQQTISRTETSAIEKLRARFSGETIGGRVRIQAHDVSRVIAMAVASPLPSLAATDSLPDSICWMPAGTHAITAGTMDGDSYAGKVICDEQASRVVAASFASITGAGGRVWIDLNHDDAAAAAWVKSFSWDPTKGILAHVEWTPRGESAIRGKEYF